MANLDILFKSSPNLFHLYRLGQRGKHILHALIEINAGSINKYERLVRHMKLDREDIQHSHIPQRMVLFKRGSG
jgi:hypothetical protein